VARLSIRLLGPFDVTLDGEPVTSFATDKVRALLAYLAMNPDQPHRRETLAGLLWPDYPERSARASLRNALGNLRRVIGDHGASPPFLIVTRQTIRFNSDSDHWLDAAAFSSLLAANEAASGTLERAVALYRGPFLEGFSASDSPAFEEWALLTREQLSRQVGEALHDLVQWHQARGAYDQALPHAWRHVELDPWREESQRQLMALLAHSSQRTAALAQYQACCQVLADELGVEPEPETTQLYEQIRDSKLKIPSVAPAPLREPGPVSQLPGFLAEGAEEAPLPVFVARQRELAWLESSLEDTLAGRGQVVFVTGGPGRGKTALLGEFSRRTMEANPGLLVASGTCNAYSGVGDPYLPFREVLAMLTGDVEASWAAGAISREHAQRLWAALPLAGQALLDHGPHVAPALISCLALLDRAAAAAPAGAAWLHQLTDRIDCSQTSAEALEETDLFQQVTNLLRALAKAQPLLLVLDDLQWVDSASAGLLFHLGRRLAGSRILIAGAYRPEEITPRHASSRDPRSIPHPLEKVLAELQRQFGDVLLDLAGVQEPEGRRFVDSLLDSKPNRLGEGFRSALFAHTGGHPLFTVELLRAMQERGDLLQDEGGAWVEGPALDWTMLPPRVEGIIKARIGRLNESQRELLSVASVEGETFTAQVVARVQGLSDRQALRLLSRDLEARHHLVHERSVSSMGARWLSRYRFSHALFQQYLYQSLGEGERVLLHGEVAGVLEELYQGQLEEVAVVLAHHYAKAHDHDRALKYFTLAGDVALAAYASRAAEGYYRRALGLVPPTPEEATLLSNLGEALARQNRFQEAMGIWRDGIERYQELEDIDAMARLYARSAWAASQTGDSAEYLALCLEGLAQTGEAPDGPGLARLLHETAIAYSDHASRKEGKPFAQRALEMTERLGDVELQVHALTTWGIFAPSSEDTTAMTARAVALAEASGLLLAAQRARTYMAYRMSYEDDHRAEREHFRRGAELAGQAGLTAAQIQILANLVQAFLWVGELEEAGKSLAQAHLLLRDLSEPTKAETEVLIAEINYLGLRGQWAACAQQARALRGSMRERGATRDLARVAIWLGWAILEPCRLGTDPHAGEWEVAEAALAEATEIFDRSLSANLGIVTRVLWGTLCLLQGRLADARRLLAEASEKAEVLPRPAWMECLRQGLEAQVSAAGGDWAEAWDCFEAACEGLARTGVHWWRARVLLDWAEAHAARGQPGDRLRAAELLHEAQEAFQEMGVARYAAIAQERLQALRAAAIIPEE